ncbi:hypothetical protein QQP08_004011 [Theobroma cacao]|nr:hypothetical protein QQP08_004011 [Theobroma cacao]
MASLVLLLSELLRHHEPNFAFETPPPSSSCFSSPPPPASCGASMSFAAKKRLRNDANKYESEIVKEDPQELRVSVDLVWP